MNGDILAVVGAQYGSEGKGNLVAHLANEYDVHVRVGGPNAGHSFQFNGRTWKMQSIPCGWINPRAQLVIGRGALVSIEQLFEELEAILEVDATIWRRIAIDPLAGIVSPWHKDEAGGVKGEAHKRYGSTGEGVGVARIARIQRVMGGMSSGFYRAGDLPLRLVPEKFREMWESMLMPDTPGILEERRLMGQSTLLEGTQGSALSLIHGPWPYVTNHETNAAQMAADCGIPPRFVNRCLLVMRTMPIRVAGNSGPLPGETSWEDLSTTLGKEVSEKTTVTKKIRRIGAWDERLVLEAVKLNGPTSLAINFVDYLSPEDTGKTDSRELSDKTSAFIEYVERMCEVGVQLVGTGGDGWSICDRRTFTREEL